MEAPPPPPPHGEHPRSPPSGGLPDGKYDIFVVPPSSAGSGFLYLPSLQTQRNSFLAGCACTATVFFLYNVALPVIKDWLYSTVNGGGSGLMMLVIGVGVVAWALGKTQGESGFGSSTAQGSRSSSQGQSRAHTQQQQAPPDPQSRPQTPPKQPPPQTPPPKFKSSWQRPQPGSDGKTAWEKAREETRKKEEQRKKEEELKRRREELEAQRQKLREKERLEKLEREWKQKKEAEEKTAKETADKERLTKEKEELERKLQREKERREREEREKKGKEGSPPKRPPMPSARTARDDDDAYSFRPYDRPNGSAQQRSAGSVYSDDSYAPSATTAKTTPPLSTRGPYTTKDPDKIIIKGVYSFNNAFMRTPISQLLSNQGSVTDGLILRITTEGLFIDDDVRGVPQREWDVKAWTMKAAEHCDVQGKHILRASIRDQEGKKYVFVLNQSEGWKVAVGLQKLRKGTQVRALNVAGLPANEARLLLETLGYS